MKKMYQIIPVILLALIPTLLFAQTPSCRNAALEMAAGAGNPTTNGPSVANQVITFQNNTDNPTGTTFAAYAPTLTATYSLSNQQYTAIAGLTSPNDVGMRFGAGINNVAGPLFDIMNGVANANATNFSTEAYTAGTGLSITVNKGVDLNLGTRALQNIAAPLVGTYYYGDLTITFNQPVDRPIIHFADFGGFYTSGTSHFITSEYELQGGLTATRLSGDAAVTITGGNYISANITSTVNTGNFFDGSFMVNANGVSSITMKVYMKGFNAAGAWSGTTAATPNAGEEIIIGVSLPDLVPPAPVPTATTITNICPSTTFNLDIITPAAVAGQTYEWHTVATNPTAGDLVTNTTTQSGTGPFYLYAKDNLTGCFSTASPTVYASFAQCPISTCSTIPDLWAAPGKTLTINGTTVSLTSGFEGTTAGSVAGQGSPVTNYLNAAAIGTTNASTVDNNVSNWKDYIWIRLHFDAPTTLLSPFRFQDIDGNAGTNAEMATIIGQNGSTVVTPTYTAGSSLAGAATGTINDPAGITLGTVTAYRQTGSYSAATDDPRNILSADFGTQLVTDVYLMWGIAGNTTVTGAQYGTISSSCLETTVQSQNAACTTPPYKVYEYNRLDPGNVTNLPVQIIGATTTNVTLNEATAGADLAYNGFNWKLLASNIVPDATNKIDVKFVPTTGTNGTYMFADAILITNGFNTIVLDDNDPGFSRTGTWVYQGPNFSTAAYLGDNTYATPGPYTGRTATWSFTNLPTTVTPPTPIPTANTISKICPATTYNLTSLNPTQPLPSGYTYQWHSGTPATAANLISSPTVVPEGPGPFYLSIDGPTGCYSNSSSPVTGLSGNCACPIAVNSTTPYISVGPANFIPTEFSGMPVNAGIAVGTGTTGTGAIGSNSFNINSNVKLSARTIGTPIATPYGNKTLMDNYTVGTTSRITTFSNFTTPLDYSYRFILDDVDASEVVRFSAKDCSGNTLDMTKWTVDALNTTGLTTTSTATLLTLTGTINQNGEIVAIIPPLGVQVCSVTFDMSIPTANVGIPITIEKINTSSCCGALSAGPDTTVCKTGTATMAAVYGTAACTWVPLSSNPGTSTITAPTSNTSTITGFSTLGTYKYVWTSEFCSDTVTVQVIDCTDCDGDGVYNINDLDDDNDGVADSVECPLVSVQLNGLTPLQPATIPATGLVTGDRVLKSNALTYLGQSYDAVIVITGSNMGTTAAADAVSLSGTGNLQITNSIPSQNPYVSYDIVFVPTGTATPTGTLVPATIPELTLILGDIDGNNNAGLGDVMGVSNSFSSSIATIGSKLTSAGFIAGGPGAGYTYYRPIDLDGTTVVTNATSGDPLYQASLKYSSYTKDNFVYGVTGSQTTVNSARGQEVYMVTTGGCDTDGDGTPNVCDLDSDNDGCSDAFEAGATTNVSSNYSFPLPVNPNGVPTAVPVYTSTYNPNAVNNTIKPCCGTLNAGPDKTACQFGTATMAAVNGPGVATWTAQAGNPGTATITTPTSTTTTITGFSAAGTYKFIWSNGSCSDTVNIVVNPLPAAGADQSVCLNNTATMAASGTGTWTAVTTPANPAVATITTPTSPTTTITGLSVAGTYNFVWTNSNGCTDTASVLVRALPTVAITPGGPTTFCSGGSVSLALNATGGTSYTYQWYKDAVAIGGATNATYDATQSGVYSVTVTNEFGCVGTSAGTTVTINPLPSAAISNGATVGTSCGSNALLTATTSAASPTYQWYKNGVLISGANAATYSATPPVTGSDSYTVVITDGVTGCSQTSAATQVLAPPTAGANGSQSICQGSSVGLTTNAVYGGNNNFRWYRMLGATPNTATDLLVQGPTASATSDTYNANATGSYYCEVRNSGDNNPVTTCPIVVTVNANPTPAINVTGGTTVCAPASVPLAADATYSSYQWLLGGNPISGATSNTYTATQPGSYTLQVTNASGCIGTSAATVITVESTPLAPVPTATTLTNSCPSQTVNLTTIQPAAASGTTLEWHTGNTSGSPIVTPATSVGAGTYYLFAKSTSPSGCYSAASTAVTVTINGCPVPDVNATYVNVPVTGNVNTNDSVPAGSTYGTPVPQPGNPSGGTITMNPDGTYTFSSPNPGVYNYLVPVCAPAQVPPCPMVLLTITVTGNPNTTSNNPPIANTDIATTPVNTPVTLNTLANDAAGNAGGTLNPASVTVVDAPNNGTTSVNPATGAITYTPNPGFTGTDTLRYQVCDNSTPTPLCTTALQIITVLPTGTPNTTTAADDYNQTTAGTPASGNVLNNDTDAEGNTQTVTPQTTTIPGIGTLVLNSNGTYTFTPAPGFSGPVEFPYTVCDNGTPQACTQATLHILVAPAPDPEPDVNATYVNVPVTGNVGTNDDVPAGTTYGSPTAVPGNPGGAMPTINPDGTYTFTSPVPGVFQFLVPVCAPGQTPPCPTELLTITVTGNPNTSNTNPPIANTDIASTPINTPVTLNTLANDAAGNAGGSLNPASVTILDYNGGAPGTTANGGTATVNPATGAITYTPPTGFVGVDTLRYQVCDNSTPTPLCTTALQIITVLPTGTPNTTVAADDYSQGPINTPQTGNVKLNDTDPEGNTQTVTPQTTTIPGKGTLVLAADGSYTFTPVPGFSGPVEFPYTVCDNGTPQACTEATLHILVAPAPAPDPEPDVNATYVNVPVTGNVSTNDNVPAGTTYGSPTAVPGNPGSAMPTINPDGTYTFTSPVPGVFQFLVEVCSPGQSSPCPTELLTITVTGNPNTTSNNPPIANTDIANTPINTPVTLNTLANDAAGNIGGSLNPASVTILDYNGGAPGTTANGGTATVNPATGAITYTPPTGFVGVDTLRYQVCDNSTPTPLCTTALQIITVLPAGTPNTTVAADDYNQTTSGVPVSGSVLLNDTDPEGNTQTVTPQTTTIPGKGTLILNSDGTYTFTPVPGFSGPVEYPYTVCDNGTPQACTQATLHILVSPAPDPDPDVNATFVNVPVTGNVNTNDEVPPGTTYGSPTAVPGNPDGSMPTINPDGTYTFTSPVPGVFQFLVEVCAPGQASPCPTELLTITVTGGSTATVYPPVANTDITTTPVNTPVTLNTLANDAPGNNGGTLNPASVTVVTPPAHGTTSVNPATGEITYTPNAGYTGTDTLRYQVCDMSTPTPFCATALQIITITPAGAPNSTVAADDYNQTPINTPVSGNVLNNDSDPQGNTQTVTPQTTTIPGKGTLVLNADGTYTFTPVTGYVGPVEFPYTVCDNGTPQACTKATLHILIDGTSVLAVRLVSFNATESNCKTTLSWLSATEDANFNHYEIEYSKNGTAYTKVGLVNAKGTNSNYTLSHTPQDGKAYYRLKMVDNNGAVSYSKVAVVSISCNTTSVQVYPNPATDAVTIQPSANLVGKTATVTIFAVDGRLVYQKRITTLNKVETLNVSQLIGGTYVLKVVTESGVFNKQLEIIK